MVSTSQPCGVSCRKSDGVTVFSAYSVTGNEWKTRYETQLELNGQLDRQMSLIHERLEDLRGHPMGDTSLPRRPDPVKSLLQDPFERRTLGKKLHVKQLSPDQPHKKTTDCRKVWLAGCCRANAVFCFINQRGQIQHGQILE
uniref:Uncharacterized protein n=1 Tax=Cyclopterus lumpus TaxID=8103 RepID=A0A8C2ZXY4_CYCLU